MGGNKEPWPARALAEHGLDDGAATLNGSSFDADTVAFAEQLELVRPAGTDSGVAGGTPQDGTEVARGEVFLVRIPGDRWRVCGVKSENWATRTERIAQ